MAETRQEKKIEKQLDRAEKQHDKAAVQDAKGHLHSAERHQGKALMHEKHASQIAGAGAYTGLNYPLTGSAVHPVYGYHRLPRDKKAERLEAKAMEWARRGNSVKAQKNRDKALRHRQRGQPGYVPIAHPQPYYVDKANRFDQRAFRYQQMGMLSQAQRYQQRALRTRTKHNVPGTLAGPGAFTTSAFPGAGLGSGLATGMGAPMMGAPVVTQTGGAYVGPIVPVVGGTVYKGLAQPLTGASQHPTFGYSRLTSTQKGQRYNTKAAEWEKRGDMKKAQKNREKAARYQQMGQQGFVKPSRTQDYYMNKAASLDQKAVRYQQQGNNDRALRSQQRAQRIRTKHSIPLAVGAGVGAGFGASRSGHQSYGTYQGLNFPYTGATNHPQYGYSRLSRDQKMQRYEAKAAEWERRGNTIKAQKNRTKANQYRQRSQPGYVKPTRQPTYYTNRANLFDQKAGRYRQYGMMPQAQRYEGRSQRIRTKYPQHFGGAAGALGAGALGAGAVAGHGSTQRYQGLNFPYTGAINHPQYGYPRLSKDQKAQRYEAKAGEWERRGNMTKAQKNREKANRYRAMSQPGYVRPTRQPDYYTNRANLFDQRAQQYQTLGMAAQAQRYRGRSRRIRSKHNMPLAAGGHYGSTWTTGQTYVGPLVPTGTTQSTYSGLNFPYTGAAAHPTYGYMRLPHNKKAERFELKAAEWERKGNMAKAQKNREKANRYRARSQPGYVAPVRQPTYYANRANTFDQKAYQYQQWGMQPQAQRYQARAHRIRTKRNIPLAGATGAGSYPVRPQYQGLNFPYTGAAAHPTYGYMRLPADKKADRFDLKAAEWERKGNLKKAQKNRNKALRHRAKKQPGYTPVVRPQNYYVDRANLFDQKAAQYQQWGMAPNATRYQQRATRLRAKHQVPPSSTLPLYYSAPVQQTAMRV